MAERNSYVTEVLRGVEERYKNEPEFVQAVTEVFDSIEPIVAKNEEIYRKNATGLYRSEFRGRTIKEKST